ncbi:D-alanine--D-alanine ligase family protein [Legionella impletisoli]|uniref:D-alanine--D-alanine ligase n=1 Tax=Legionella impletisoli TaxID=343510 RepID=A0A917JV71_9GAMM|nr:D-alanine--D-alanine ligase family protein [Legionella impletisoli]GGI88685.1 D-alanine--D-alanine ligase [Legionella impletisoli]
MPKPMTVVLLYGGKSGEHEISLISAASILNHLDAERYQIIPVGMDKNGHLFINEYEDLLNYKESLPVQTSHSRPLESLIVNGALALKADVVFPIVHGPLYEDGCLQGVLELADVAYVGCDVLASALGMDKDISRRLTRAEGIKSARFQTFSSRLSNKEAEAFCYEVSSRFGWPLFVKPCSMGSSVGIHKVHNMEELLAAVKDAGRFDTEVVVEEFIKGREIELAVLEHHNPSSPPNVSLPGEICVKHRDGFYSYTAKYLESNMTELSVPALLSESVINRLQTAAREIFMILKCKGMARVDFFYDEENDEIYFNEINSIPGFTTISMYPKLWEASGLSYKDLLNELIELAQIEHQIRRQLVTHYQ